MIMEKSWKSHGISVLITGGNPVILKSFRHSDNHIVRVKRNIYLSVSLKHLFWVLKITLSTHSMFWLRKK